MDYLLNANDAIAKLRASVHNIGHSSDGIEHFKFVITANQQYRLWDTIPYFPICLELKHNQCKLRRNTTHPQSHIFPECLLKACLKNHFHGVTNYKSKSNLERQSLIYDVFSKSFKSAHKLTYPLFCYACEENASRKEDFLKYLYLSIMGDEDGLIIDREQLDSLKYILALLLF